MGQLFSTIRRLVVAGRYIIREHASERLEERGIMEWQVAVGLENGDLVSERPNTKLHPKVGVHQLLEGGVEVEVVWSYPRQSQVAKLVTVYFIRRGGR